MPIATTDGAKEQSDSKLASAAPRRNVNGSSSYVASWMLSGRNRGPAQQQAQQRDHVSELVTEDNGDARLEFSIGDQIAVLSGNYSNYGTHAAVSGYVVQVCYVLTHELSRCCQVV